MSRSDEMVMQEPEVALEGEREQRQRSRIAWGCWTVAGPLGLHRVYLLAPSLTPLLGWAALAACALSLQSLRRRREPKTVAAAFVSAVFVTAVWVYEAVVLRRLLGEHSARRERDLAAQRISMEREEDAAPSEEALDVASVSGVVAARK